MLPTETMTTLLADDLREMLEHSAPLWDAFRGSRIFFTGGTGALGAWILESVLWAQDQLDLGAEITLLTRDPEAFKRARPHLAGHPAVRLQQGDVRSLKAGDGRYSHLIHAAGDVSGTIAADTTIDGTRRVLDFAGRCGVGRFLFLSSGGVYGKLPAAVELISENDRGAEDSLSVYGTLKRRAEGICLEGSNSGFNPVIARCFAYVGPYLPLDSHFAAGNFIRDCLKGGPIEIKSDGTALRSFIYGSDLAIWLWTLLVRGHGGETYNVGSEETVSIADLAQRTVQAYRRTSGRDIEVKILGQTIRSLAPDRYVPSTHKASLLGLRRYVSLDDGILRTFKWLASLP